LLVADRTKIEKLDLKCIYICDCDNHRIQILTKDKGIFVMQWGSGEESTDQGQFSNPMSIYNNLGEEIFYVGDNWSVQLFEKDGNCIQRLGQDISGNSMNQFHWITSLCVMDDRLYVCDHVNQRIQIFQKKVIAWSQI